MNDYRQDVAIHRLDESNHLHSLRAGVAVPIGQALVTGVLIALLVALVAGYYRVPDWYFWAAISGVLAVLGQWIFSQMLWQRLVRLVERQTYMDIDGDGVIGEPEQTPAAPQTVRVEVTDKTNGQHVTQYIDLPFAERIPQLAAGLAAGKQFTVSNWVGVSRGRLFTPAEFTELRAVMIEHDWIRPNNPHDETRGYSLTRAGLAIMRSLAA